MIYEISNEYLVVKINDLGAELNSIKKQFEDIEYLWQLNKKIWERQAPLLFPIIGRLKDEQFEYNKKLYNINIHGFANTSVFSLHEKKADSITLVLKNSEKTLKQYPFKFELYISYSLIGNKIIKKQMKKRCILKLVVMKDLIWRYLTMKLWKITILSFITTRRV